MGRVLHLLHQNADYPTRCMAVTLAQRLADEFTPTGLTVGRGGDLRDVLTAARHLESLQPTTVVHAWGTLPLIAASLAGCPSVIISPPTDPNHWDRRWLGWLGRRKGARVVFSSESQRQRAGFSGESDLIHFGVETSVKPEPALRKWLGFSDDDFVILAAGESTAAAKHELAVWITAILHVLDPSWKLLAWGRGDRAAKLWQLIRSLNAPKLLRTSPDLEFEMLLAAADVVLAPGVGERTSLPVALCMAAGIPVIEMAKPRATAQHLMDLRNDAALRRTMAEAARSDAAKFFSLRPFLEKFRGIYREAQDVRGSRCSPASQAFSVSPDPG